jgi:hypothetical protein
MSVHKPRYALLATHLMQVEEQSAEVKELQPEASSGSSPLGHSRDELRSAAALQQDMRPE